MSETIDRLKFMLMRSEAYGTHGIVDEAACRDAIAEIDRLTSEAAEIRVVLRQFDGRDLPLRSVDIARSMLNEIERLRAERDEARAAASKLYDGHVAHGMRLEEKWDCKKRWPWLEETK